MKITKTVLTHVELRYFVKFEDFFTEQSNNDNFNDIRMNRLESKLINGIKKNHNSIWKGSNNNKYLSMTKDIQ